MRRYLWILLFCMPSPFQTAKGWPAPALVPMVVETQTNQTWDNNLRHLDPDGEPARHAEAIQEKVADTGEVRRLVRTYSRRIGVPLVSETREEVSGQAVTYEYDEDGYLIRVQWNDGRLLTLTWELLSPDAPLPLKRLVRVEQGKFFETYGYLKPEDISIDRLEDGFGERPLIWAHDDQGRIERLVFSGNIGPDFQLTFADNEAHQGFRLTTTYGPPNNPATLTWTVIADEQARLLRLAGDSRLTQTFAHDGQGRLESETILSGSGRRTYTYGNDAGPFFNTPTLISEDYIDGQGALQTRITEIESTPLKTTLTRDGLSVIHERSNSGAPTRFTNLFGQKTGPGNTRFYQGSDEGTGYAADAVGRPLKRPYAGKTTARTTWQWNQALMAARTDGGLERRAGDRDKAGIPAGTTWPSLGGRDNLNPYNFAEGLLHQEHKENGVTVTASYDRDGLLRRRSLAGDGGSQTYDLDYDDFYRLIQVRRDGEQTYAATYDNSLTHGQPLSETEGPVTRNYTVATDSLVPRITAVTVTVDGQTWTEELVTDGLGRVVKSEAPGGQVTLSYDAFDRLIQIKRSDEGENPGQILRTWTYEPGKATVAVKDERSGLVETVTLNDAGGFAGSRTFSFAGIAFQHASWSTELDTSGGTHTYKVKRDQGVLSVQTTHDALGNLLTHVDAGGLETNVTKKDNRGRVTQYAGVANGSLDYDALDRPSAVTRNGHQTKNISYTPDGRLTSLTDAHGKAVELSYDTAKGDDPTRVVRDNLTLDERTDQWDGESQTPLELQTSRSTVVTDDTTTTTLTRAGQTATVVANTKSGALQNLTTYGGLSVTYPKQDGFGRYQGDIQFSLGTTASTRHIDWVGNIMTTHLANGPVEVLAYDPLDRLVGYAHAGGLGVARVFDSSGRLSKVVQTSSGGDHSQSGFQFLDLDYTGHRLTSIKSENHRGGRFNLAQEWDDHRLKNRSLIRGEEVIFNQAITYQEGYPNVPATITETTPGVVRSRTFDSFGRVTQIKEPYRAAVDYTWNSWDLPATLNGHDLFGERGERSWSVGNGVHFELDQRGLLTGIRMSGMADQHLEYDGDHRLLSSRYAGEGEPQYTWTHGLAGATSLIVSDGASAELIEFHYDDQHRLKMIDRATHDELFAYSDDGFNRLVSKTDPNGVTATYRYDGSGNLIGINLDGGNAPEFQFSHDVHGNLASVASSGGQGTRISAEYLAYQGAYPSGMTWKHGAETFKQFAIGQTDGKLGSITSLDGSLGLALEWGEGTSREPMLSKIERRGPAYREEILPKYTGNRLASVEVRRFAAVGMAEQELSSLEEFYNTNDRGIPERLLRTERGFWSEDGGTGVGVAKRALTRDPDASRTLLDLRRTVDPAAGRVTDMSGIVGETGSITAELIYDQRGNLTLRAKDGEALNGNLVASDGSRVERYSYDGFRRVKSLEVSRSDGDGIYRRLNQVTDLSGYRVSAEVEDNSNRRYFYHASKLLAVGDDQGWRYAIGHGPLGPAYIKDLHSGDVWFLLTDHLGTPFAWVDAYDRVTYTPYSPWGELWAKVGDKATFQGAPNIPKKDLTPPPPADPNANPDEPTPPHTPTLSPAFQLPELLRNQGNAPIPSLGGHPYDHGTGLIYMHNRWYHPRLGHFLNPDFRAPDIYDPSTWQEPYAYAAGNPVMFMDPDGLDPTSMPFNKTVADFGGDEDRYVEALIQFLSQKGFLTRPNSPYPGYTNFDPASLLFSQITTPRELDYQISILGYVLRRDVTSEIRAVYGHFLDELTGIKGEYLEKRDGWFAQHQIWWGNQWETEGWMELRTGARKHPTEWVAEINNYAGQANMYQGYVLLESMLVAAGSARSSNVAPPIIPSMVRSRPGLPVTTHLPVNPPKAPILEAPSRTIRKPSVSQAKLLQQFGVDKAGRRAFFKGQVVDFAFPTRGGDDVIGFLHMKDGRLVSQLFSINNQSGGAVKAFLQFRNNSLKLGKALGVNQVELQGGSVINPRVEQFLRKQGFSLQRIPVPEAYGGGTQEAYILILSIQ